jgi:YcaO-like protein with predicted kinase domain
VKLFGREQDGRKVVLAGTQRACSPDETLRAFAPLMPRLGITRLANITGLDRIGIPVFTAIRPCSRGLATSQGKGLTPQAAKVSALMESIESWHAERIEREVRYEPWIDLAARAPVCEISSLARLSDTELDPTRPILWIEGWDLIGERAMWVPYAAVTTSFVEGECRASAFFRSSNGLASGNTALEATLHGLLEVIERDAVALWERMNASERDGRQLDLATVDDPVCAHLLRTLDDAGIDVALWDVTSDVGVPAYACHVVEREAGGRARPQGAFSGYGAHLSTGVALSRAITEAVQSRATMIAGSRDDLLPERYAACANEDDHAALRATTQRARGDFRDRRPRDTERFESDLAVVLDSLKAAGARAAVTVDLSRRELGVPVVKVIVPGLESVAMAPQLRPGWRAPARLAPAAREANP